MSKRNQIKRHFPHIPLLISTDLTGVLALKPQLFYQLYHTISVDSCPLDGVEFLPFSPSHHRVEQMLTKFNIPIVGIHGPVLSDTPEKNLSEKIFSLPFVGITPSLKNAIKSTQRIQPSYLLFHEPDLDNCHFAQRVNNYLEQDSTPVILLENVYRPNSLQISVDKAKKLSNQTQAGVMIDLVHLLREVVKSFNSFSSYRQQINPDNIDQHWFQMLLMIDRALSQLPIAGFHIPLGSSRGDSLPWELIKAKHWRQLAQLINKHQKRLIAIVLENQHPENTLSINRKYLPKILQDKKHKLKTLVKLGVL